MASADASRASVLAAETAGRGAARMGRNLGLGLGWISTEQNRESAYYKAVDQVRYAAERERSGASSIGQIDPTAASLSRLRFPARSINERLKR